MVAAKAANGGGFLRRSRNEKNDFRFCRVASDGHRAAVPYYCPPLAVVLFFCPLFFARFGGHSF